MLGAALLLVLAAAPSLGSEAAAPRPPQVATLHPEALDAALLEEAAYAHAPPRDTALVGVIVDGREIDVIEILIDADGSYLLPLEPFLAFTGTRLQAESGDRDRSLVTPLGTVELTAPDIQLRDGVTYLSQTFIEQRLASPLRFDERLFALRLDLAWQPYQTSVTLPLRPAAEVLQPEFEAPVASLSTIQTDLEFFQDDDVERFNSATVLGGRLSGGWWRLRYQDDFAGGERLRDYAWLRPLNLPPERGNGLLQIGHQRVQLHPLLRVVELTGVQGAWTDQPLDRFARSQFQPVELLSRQGTPQRTFRGPGPPAGIAELWIDDRLTDRRTIGLNGMYEFFDIPLPARLSRVEVRVYERQNPRIPVNIIEETLNLSAYLLPAGGSVHLGGGGHDGNLAQDALDQRDGSAAAGFYQFRQGLHDRVTFESVVQQSRENLQVLTGLVAQLSPTFTIGGAIASSIGGSVGGDPAQEREGDTFGYSFDLDGQIGGPTTGRGADRFGGVRLLVRSLYFEAGFQSEAAAEAYDHLVETNYQHSRRLSLGLVARSRRQGDSLDEFVLPTLSWRPVRRLSLRARPQVDGDYQVDLNYAISRRGQLAVSIQERTFAGLSYALGRELQLYLSAEHGGGQVDRYAALLAWSRQGRWQPSLTAGPIFVSTPDTDRDGNTPPTADRVGFQASLNLALLPGVLARFEVAQDPLRPAADGSANLRLQLNLTADLALSRGRLLPARSVSVRADRGALSGQIRVEAPPELAESLDAFSLDGLTLLLNGRVAGRSEFGGSFFIGDLEPGLYRVELDPENLPIELNPVRVSVVAQVAPAAVTRVDFSVRPEFGVAGRVTDTAGVRRRDVLIEALDSAGTVAGTARTDRFGLFRIDGLGIGTYTLRLAPANFSSPPAYQLPSRRIEVRDDFLFDQDLQLDTAFSDLPFADD